MRAEFRPIEVRVVRKIGGESYIETTGALLVDQKPVPTKEPLVVTRKLTAAESELLDLLLQETKKEQI
jgi:hypothetical protein